MTHFTPRVLSATIERSQHKLTVTTRAHRSARAYPPASLTTLTACYDARYHWTGHCDKLPSAASRDPGHQVHRDKQKRTTTNAHRRLPKEEVHSRRIDRVEKRRDLRKGFAPAVKYTVSWYRGGRQREGKQLFTAHTNTSIFAVTDADQTNGHSARTILSTVHSLRQVPLPLLQGYTNTLFATKLRQESVSIQHPEQITLQIRRLP